MKDQIFTGRTVGEAVEVAGRTLGLAPDAIRYVVLERESPGVLGMGGASARIAVLLDPGRGSGGPRAAPAPESRRREERPIDPQAGMRGLVREFAEKAGLDLSADVEETEQRTTVRLSGSDRAFLLANGGEVLVAMDHILQRAFARDVHPARLVVECDGFREARDAALSERAKELARQVREDGCPRETEALNAYERRIIHVALTEEPGVRTFSVGEGGDRRVTVAPKDPDPGDAA